MKEEFVSYSQAVKLKECGFDWECYTFWSKEVCTDGTPTKIRRTKTKPKVCVMSECNSMLDKIGSDLITAPTQALAQKWLRDVKGIDIDIRTDFICMQYDFVVIYKQIQIFGHKGYPTTYELTLSAALDAAIELIKQK